MGRYTSIQGFTNHKTKLVGGYAAAAAASGGAEGAGAPKAPPRPDKVENVMGSTAGAGSCDFHLYRAARSREVSRLETLENAEALAQERTAFSERVDKNRQEAEERTKRNAEKRKKRKQKKLKANASSKESDDEEDDAQPHQKAKRTEDATSK